MDAYGSVYTQPLKYILTHKKQASIKRFLKVIGWIDKSEEEVELSLRYIIVIINNNVIKLFRGKREGTGNCSLLSPSLSCFILLIYF